MRVLEEEEEEYGRHVVHARYPSSQRGSDERGKGESTSLRCHIGVSATQGATYPRYFHSCRL